MTNGTGVMMHSSKCFQHFGSKAEVYVRWIQLGGGEGACPGHTREVAHRSPSLKVSARAPGEMPVEMGTTGVVTCRDRGVSSGHMGPLRGE